MEIFIPAAKVFAKAAENNIRGGISKSRPAKHGSRLPRGAGSRIHKSPQGLGLRLTEACGTKPNNLYKEE